MGTDSLLFGSTIPFLEYRHQKEFFDILRLVVQHAIVENVPPRFPPFPVFL